MKTKTIQISVAINDDRIFAIQNITELLAEGEAVEFDIYPEDIEKNQMLASYEYNDSEINETFTDKDVCEDYTTTQMATLEAGKMYNCIGVVTDMAMSEDNTAVILEITIPLFSEEEGEDLQELELSPGKYPKISVGTNNIGELGSYTYHQFVPQSATPELQKYEIKIVGIRHQASGDAYKKMEELSRNRGEVILQHEADNEKDPFAVAVYLPTNERVGYVAAKYLPVVFREVKQNGQLMATVTYMEPEGASATAVMEFESNISVMAAQLFSAYTPVEVYKANRLYCLWGGTLEHTEIPLIDEDNHSINFDLFCSLDINTQNYIAAEWERRMHKATVENPTNPGKRMSVPLDLAVYGTSWKELDISDLALIQSIESDNKIVAIYFRFRRTEPGGMMISPRTFIDNIVKVDAGEELKKRLGEVFEKRMS